MNTLLRVCACIAIPLTVNAQTSVPLAFEVVSIKPSPALADIRAAGVQPHIGTKIDRARADFGATSVAGLITRAYGVRFFQLSGPKGIDSGRFDVLGKLPEGSSVDQVPEMVKTLLKDRFKLEMHMDSKEFPVYALVLGKDGPKFDPKPADYDSTVKSSLRPTTMENYAMSLLLDHPVVELTGLKGEYMLDTSAPIRILLDRAHAKSVAMKEAGGAAGSAASDLGDTGAFFELVRKLGMKLEPRKMMMPMLVIDHVQLTPTEE